MNEGAFPVCQVKYLGNALTSRISMPDSDDEEIMRKMDELMKDPKRFDVYVASRLDMAVKNWPRH
jgi:hypothetical protein